MRQNVLFEQKKNLRSPFETPELLASPTNHVEYPSRLPSATGCRPPVAARGRHEPLAASIYARATFRVLRSQVKSAPVQSRPGVDMFELPLDA